MFKKLLLVLCLLALCITVSSAGITDKLKTVVARKSVAAGDSCSTSGMTFSWHCEDADVEADDPAGCTIANTKSCTQTPDAVISGTQYHDGNESLSIPTSYDRYSCDNNDNGNQVIYSNEGTVKFYVYIDTFGNLARVFRYNVTTNEDELFISMTGSAEDIEFRIYHEGQDGGQKYATTSDHNGVEDTWYLVIGKWKTGDVDPNLSIQACDTNGANCCTEATDPTNTTTFASEGATFDVGSTSGTAGPCYIDQVQIWKTWQ